MDSHEWVISEFQGLNLGDRRLNKRLETLTSQLFSGAESSIPVACSGWTGAKACYRFFNNPKVDDQKIINTHRLKSIERINKDETVLVIQDTTKISYETHPNTKGLGQIGTNKKLYLKGLIMHTALAISTAGVPIGILSQKIYARPYIEGLQSLNRHKIPIEEKESNRWLEALRYSTKNVTNPSRFVTVADREADIYEFMLEAEKLSTKFLVRARINRDINKAARRSKTEQKIWDYMASQNILGHYETAIPDKDNENKKRKVRFSIKLGSFIIQPPNQIRGYILKDPKPIRLYAIFVQEDGKSCQDNEDRIEGMLLTNLPTTSMEEAVTRVDWYKLRWHIELFHKVLKSGYRVEACRLAEATRLKKYLTVMSIISFRILFITYLRHSKVTTSANKAFSKNELAILAAISKTDKKKLKLDEAILVLAKLGGFFSRATDGPPGFISIWRGFKRLHEMLAGVNAMLKQI